MTDPVDLRLQRLLGGDHLASLRERLRRRFERAPLDGVVEHMRVNGLTADEHAALAALAGRPQRYARSLRIDISRIDAALQRSGTAASLREALELIDGPIVHRAARRLHLRTLWSRVVAGCTHPDLAAFLDAPDGLALLKRVARQSPQAAAVLCHSADAVLQCLPAQGIARAQLAADVLGDAHALDNGQPVATLVLAVRRRLLPATDEDDDASIAAGLADNPRPPAAVERARDIWAAAGILVNELARPALFLNLSAGPPVGSAWRPGEPGYLSLRSLLRSSARWDVAGRPVYVCENPNLVAIAADRLGRACAPLVCTEGMPAAAQRCLLSQLVEAGARLRYHGDFDWPGLRIGEHVIRAHGAEPWHFGAADYAAAVRDTASRGVALAGKPVDASWDAELMIIMQQRGISVAEEAVADSLLQDLGDRR